MRPDSDITVVVPAKNEAPTIATVIRQCCQLAADVIVVDGCSADNTAGLAADAGARVLGESATGKGLAMRRAIPHIHTGITVFIDADKSHTPGDIPNLVQPILDGRADHVSASRLIGGSSELHGSFDEFFRLAGSAFITACINKRFGVRLSDSQNGFRAIRTPVL